MIQDEFKQTRSEYAELQRYEQILELQYEHNIKRVIVDNWVNPLALYVILPIQEFRGAIAKEFNDSDLLTTLFDSTRYVRQVLVQLFVGFLCVAMEDTGRIFFLGVGGSTKIANNHTARCRAWFKDPKNQNVDDRLNTNVATNDMWWFRFLILLHIVEFGRNLYTYCQKSKNHFSVDGSASYFAGAFRKKRDEGEEEQEEDEDAPSRCFWVLYYLTWDDLIVEVAIFTFRVIITLFLIFDRMKYQSCEPFIRLYLVTDTAVSFALQIVNLMNKHAEAKADRRLGFKTLEMKQQHHIRHFLKLVECEELEFFQNVRIKMEKGNDLPDEE